MHRYAGWGTAAILTYLIVNGPDRSLQGWARPFAAQEVKEEDEIFAKYASDPDFKADLDSKFRSYGKHPDRYYDAIMMRNEYAVLKHKWEQANGQA